MSEAAAEVVRIRAPRTTTAVVVGCLALVGVVYAALHLHPATGADVPAPTEEIFLSSVYVLLLVRCVLRLFRPSGVDLRPDAIVIQGLLRGRTVAWRDVAAVGSHRYGIVVLDRTDGRPVRLEYPGGDSALRLIREWWVDRRG